MLLLNLLYFLLILMVNLPVQIAISEIHISSSSYQVNFANGISVDVMDSFILGSCLHMSLHMNNNVREGVFQAFRTVVFEDQRTKFLFSIKSPETSISASKIFTHANGFVLEDFDLCDSAFSKPLSVAMISTADQTVNEHTLKKYFIYRIFRGLDENSLAMDGVALGSYVDYRMLYSYPPNDVTTCTVARSKDWKFIRPWIEYHRETLWQPHMKIYLLVDQKNTFEGDDWTSGLSPSAIAGVEYASTQRDVELVEWPLTIKDLGVESAQYVCLQHNHILRRSLATYSSEITDFLKLSKSMTSIMDVISFLSPHCNFLAPNVYASVIHCQTGVGNRTIGSDDCISYSEMRPLQSSCRGRYNGIIVAQSRVVHLSSFKLVANHPSRTFVVGRNKTIQISNEYYRKHFPSMANYIDVVTHGITCDMVGSKEVATIVHNLDYEEFKFSAGKVSTGGLEVRPFQTDLNFMTFWKKELQERIDVKNSIVRVKNRKFYKKVNSKAVHNRKIIITLSTKPSRLKYISSIIDHIDFTNFNAIVVINLPRKFGQKGQEYPSIPPALTANKRVLIKWIPDDLGPYSKILPTLRHLFYRATANTIADKYSRRLFTENKNFSSRNLLNVKEKKPKAIIRSVQTEYESILPYEAATAVVISIDDDTVYPKDFIKRMLVALNTVRFRAVVSICGVNLTDWGLEQACGTSCHPFANPIVKENHPIFAHFGDYTNRPLTPIDVFKGFTGVAYPMDVVSRDFIASVLKLRTLDILPIDSIRGFSESSCLKSDDLVISAALHLNGIRRYRITLNDDCREGLKQYEFGYKKDALQSEGGGHHKKYYSCLRAISANQLTSSSPIRAHPTCPVVETMLSNSLSDEFTLKRNQTLNELDTEHWPYIDYSLCLTLMNQEQPDASKMRDANGLAIRWSKDWRLKASKNSYLFKCWSTTNIPPGANWRCNFPPTMPDQEPWPLNTESKLSIIPIQLAFPDSRIRSPDLMKVRQRSKKKRKENTKFTFGFSKENIMGRLFGLTSGRRRLSNVSHPENKISKVSSKLRIDASVTPKKDPSKNPTRKGVANYKGGWDRVYPYSDIYHGIFPRYGPLANDITLASNILDLNASGRVLKNEASNFFAVPFHTMKRFPKTLVATVQQRLNAVYKDIGRGFLSSIELLDVLSSAKSPPEVIVGASKHGLSKDCLEDSHRFLFDYSRKSLTTTALAHYVLKALNASDATSALFVTSSASCKNYRASIHSLKRTPKNRNVKYDRIPVPPLTTESGRCQLIDSLFHGLRTVLKSNCVDYPKLEHLYLDHYEGNTSSSTKFHHTEEAIWLNYGPQGVYLWSLADDPNVKRNEYLLGKKIDNREFDIVIYADIYHADDDNGVYVDDNARIESQYFWSKVSTAYPKSKIGFLDGLDLHESKHKKTMKDAFDKGVLFVKEIDDQMLFFESAI